MARRMTKTGTVLASIGLLAALAGCGGNGAAADNQSTNATNPLEGVDAPGINEEISAKVPEAFKKPEGLTIGTDAKSAPKEFIDENGEFSGLDVDFVYAIGNVLGIKMNFVNAGFDTLLPGVENGRYDMVASSAAPTLEREKIVDFVSVDRSGESLLVKSDIADEIGGLGDLCGDPVGAIKGSLQVTDLEEQNVKCEAEGKPLIEIAQFPDGADVNLALNSDRVVAAFLGTPTSAYQAANSNGALKVVGPIYRAGLEGIFMGKDQGLAQPVADAMNELIESGVYQQMLDKWNMSDSAIDTAYVNPATNGKAE